MHDLDLTQAVGFVGRSQELETLCRSFDKILLLEDEFEDEEEEEEELEEPTTSLSSWSKNVQIVTVAGYSGAGKSRLVQRFRETHVGTKAYYCTGKCDQTRSTEPFYCIKDALEELCSTLLAEKNTNSSSNDKKEQEPEQESGQEPGQDGQEQPRQQSKNNSNDVIENIREAMGEEGSVLCNVIPSLAGLLQTGVDADDGVASSSGSAMMAPSEVDDTSAAYDQLNVLFRALIRAIATAEKPLVLFCDDLQWVDASSLQVITWLATDPLLSHFMLVGSFRENEVLHTDKNKKSDSHRLVKALRLIQEKTSRTIRRVHLHNLTTDELNVFLAQTLRLDAQQTEPLALVVHEKTLGNPFFALQFLQELERRQMLSFSFASVQWEWIEPQRIREDTSIACNVVDLIANKIKDLHPHVQECLRIASCLSSTVSVNLLTKLMIGLGTLTGSATSVPTSLEKARDEGLMHKLSQNNNNDTDNVRFKFVHDRIQQAAYSLVGEGREREELHYRIGKQLLRFTKTNKNNSNSSSNDISMDREHDWIRFIAADQLHRGRSCITRESDLVLMARLNLAAGQKAMDLTAFSPASQYLTNGIEAMRQVSSAWEKHHELQISLHQALAQVSWCIGEPAKSESAAKCVRRHARTRKQRVPASHTLAQVFGSQQKHKEAIRVEVEELRALSVFPRSFQGLKGLSLLVNLKKRLKNISVEEVLNLPDCTDERIIHAMNLLLLLAKHATFYGDDILQLLAIVINVKLNLKYGVHKYSIACFAQIGVLVSVMFGDAKEGYRLGTMSSGLMERLRIHDTMTFVIVHKYVNPWYVPLTDSLEPLLQAYHTGMKQGNVEMAFVSFNMYLCHGFMSGLSLGPLLDDAKSHFDTIEEFGIESVLAPLRALRQAVLNLAGETKNPLILTGPAMDEEIFLSSSSNNSFALYHFYMWKMMVCFYYGDMRGADENRQQTWKLRKPAIAFCEVSTSLYFSALIPLAMASQNGSMVLKRRARSAINAVRKAVTKEHKAINLIHKLHLLDADFLALNKRKDSETIRHAYDRAITMASRAGLRQDAALGNLRAGQYFMGVDTNWATHYLSRSVELFEDWGAHGVVKYMQARYLGLIDTSTNLGLKSSDYLGRSRHTSLHVVRKPCRSPSSFLDIHSNDNPTHS